MSDPQLAYTAMADDFDILPRWQSQSSHPEPLSSSQSASAHAHSHSSTPQSAAYLYQSQSHSGPPPPPPQAFSPNSATRLQPIQPQLSGSSMGGGSGGGGGGGQGGVPYSPSSNQQNPLARSASLASASARGRRRVHDDLEGAFHADAQPAQSPYPGPGESNPQSNAYYPSLMGYRQPGVNSGNNNNPGAGGDGYGDSPPYYNGHPANANTPKRANTTRDPPTSARGARSPLRPDATQQQAQQPSQQQLLDPYSPSGGQGPYSPTSGSYSYTLPPDQRSSASAHPSTPYSHSRSHSRAKASGGGGGGESGLTPGYSSATLPPPSSAGAYGGYAMDTSTSPQPQSHVQHLSAHAPGGPSLSTPSSPSSYPHSFHPHHGAHSSSGMIYAEDLPPMVAEQQHQPRTRVQGFRRVRDSRDLRPYVNTQPAGRRMDASGAYLSPLRQLTTDIIDTYRVCNPTFKYESSHNPRRVLTKPSKPAHNEGFDNDDYDYILYVNDLLGSEESNRYLILDILGQGTFGQVVKCQNLKTHEIVAVKVVKNKPAYFNQSMMEVTILELLNGQLDPHDEHHILRLRDSFIHKNHMCLVFELLSSNLYELIKQNQFQGLSTQLVKVFTAQLLDSLAVLKDARLIHCDLKPENILLKSLQSPQIKVIDFGSTCHERQTVYTYIQSRFYRCPEVLLGIPYTAAIDMWSLGCIAVELFLGLPLLPGTSEYNQVTRIVEMFGNPPTHMLDLGKQTGQFFDAYVDSYGQKQYRLKSLEQYSREHNTNEQPGKQYFKHTNLPDIINSAPMPAFKSSRAGHETEKELNSRASFIDFCQGLLHMDPLKRWSPQQARLHPFITGEKWTGPWKPKEYRPTDVIQMPTPSPSAGPDPKRPYGGLVPSQPKGQRTYQDAATYNQHLQQQQAYNAQAAASQQAANNVLRNPYITQPPPASASSANPYTPTDVSFPPQSHASQYQTPSQAAMSSGQRPLQHQSSHGQLAVSASVSQYSTPAMGNQPLGPNPPPGAYYPARGRSNTINQIDNIPPALARLQHMNHDVIGGRNALTPVMNRGDDAIREWERRQAGKATTAQPYPELQYLHQQAELAAASGLANWGQQSHAHAKRYPSSNLAHSYQPMMDDDQHQRRDAVMSNVRSAARGDGGGAMYSSASAPNNTIASPPQAYQTGVTTAGNRFASAYGQQGPSQVAQQQTPGATPFDRNEPGDLGTTLYVPMQPDQYQSAYGAAQVQGQRGGVAPPAQSVPPAFYGAAGVGQPGQTPQMGKDGRRGSGQDLWPR